MSELNVVDTTVHVNPRTDSETNTGVTTIGSVINKAEVDSSALESADNIVNNNESSSVSIDNSASMIDTEIKEVSSAVEEKKETYVDGTGILDSGNRTEFASGAVRDIQDDKGDEYLLPFEEVSDVLSYYIKDEVINNTQKLVFSFLTDYKNTGNINNLNNILDRIILCIYGEDTPKAIMELAIHFKNGATKYSPRNWEKGMPVSNFISSFIRHFLKYIRGDQDEHHERAMMWNIICAIWTIKNHPELDDFYIKSND